MIVFIFFKKYKIKSYLTSGRALNKNTVTNHFFAHIWYFSTKVVAPWKITLLVQIKSTWVLICDLDYSSLLRLIHKFKIKISSSSHRNSAKQRVKSINSKNLQWNRHNYHLCHKTEKYIKANLKFAELVVSLICSLHPS
jgi:hypothetical protein